MIACELNCLCNFFIALLNPKPSTVLQRRPLYTENLDSETPGGQQKFLSTLGLCSGSMCTSPFAICVLNVQPDDIIWHIICVKAGINSLNVSLVSVVPSALVVSYGEILRQGRCPRQPGILCRHLHVAFTSFFVVQTKDDALQM